MEERRNGISVGGAVLIGCSLIATSIVGGAYAHYKRSLCNDLHRALEVEFGKAAYEVTNMVIRGEFRDDMGPGEYVRVAERVIGIRAKECSKPF